jgi:hypothetical protein
VRKERIVNDEQNREQPAQKGGGDSVGRSFARGRVSNAALVEEASAGFWKLAQQTPNDIQVVDVARVLHSVCKIMRSPDSRVRDTRPAQEGVSDAASLVEDAGLLLWKRAQQPPIDPVVVGAARVLHALWLMLRAHDPSAQREMRVIEKRCMGYRDERQSDTLREAGKGNDLDKLRRTAFRDLWCEEELPPREGLDRHRSLGILLSLTNHVLQWARVAEDNDGPKVEDPSALAALVFTYGVRILFPHIYAARLPPRDSPEKTKGEIAECACSIVEAWDHGEKKARMRIVYGLEKFGVPRPVTHGWLRGVKIVKSPPGKREHVRDRRGKFRRRRRTPTAG